MCQINQNISMPREKLFPDLPFTTGNYFTFQKMSLCSFLSPQAVLPGTPKHHIKIKLLMYVTKLEAHYN